MSHQYYDEIWQKTQEYLSSTLQSEAIQADRRTNRELLATLYIRYIIAANQLNECVDQMVHPQKRRLIRKLLEATLGRTLELKFDLVEADLNEWTHCGDIMDNLKITPPEMELKVPICFLQERREELEYKNNLILSVYGKLGFLDEVKKKVPMTEHQAILLIQNHERARQGRLRHQFMKEIKMMKGKARPQAADAGDGADTIGGISMSAALKIQKMWRGYITRRTTRRKKIEEMVLIGMVPPPPTENEEIKKDLENRERRRKLQKQRLKEYEEAVKNCREDLEKNQRGVVLEQLSDQVRGWLHDYKAQTGKLPEFTGSERTTSRLMMSRQGTDSELSKSTQDSKTKKDKSSKSKDSKSNEEEEDVSSSKALVSVFVPKLNDCQDEYDELWKNRDESNNPHRQHVYEVIENEQMTALEEELRKIVDQMMKAELELLQEAWDRDRGQKTKRKAVKKTRRGIKKKKKDKDLTPDRTTESLFEELIANGIIKKIPVVHLSDFKGERSFSYPVEYTKGIDPPIGLGDVRQIATEYCIIPLLSERLHTLTPLIKSVLLAGPSGSGKRMLVHAICNETGAMLFDLTPGNIVGKYPGKSGLIMLLHLVTKMSKLLQPAVIYMANAERPFVKKIPKSDKTDPKRLKKDLPKLIKGFCSEDRVILIGTSNCPWESDQKLLQQVYQKFIAIPRPDYTSRYCIWNSLLQKYPAITWQFDTSVVSKISDGYTAGALVDTINEVMTVKRVVQLRVKPFSPLELVSALSQRTPVYREEEAAMAVWWSKTPLLKIRAKAVEERLEEEAAKAAKQANKKK